MPWLQECWACSSWATSDPEPTLSWCNRKALVLSEPRALFGAFETRAHPSRRATRCAIPASAFVIRFPNGDYEYDVTRSPVPTIGETMRRKGLLWSVTRITQNGVVTVHVQRAETRESQ